MKKPWQQCRKYKCAHCINWGVYYTCTDELQVQIDTFQVSRWQEAWLTVFTSVIITTSLPMFQQLKALRLWTINCAQVPCIVCDACIACFALIVNNAFTARFMQCIWQCRWSEVERIDVRHVWCEWTHKAFQLLTGDEIDNNMVVLQLQNCEAILTVS